MMVTHAGRTFWFAGCPGVATVHGGSVDACPDNIDPITGVRFDGGLPGLDNNPDYPTGYPGVRWYDDRATVRAFAGGDGYAAAMAWTGE